MASICARPIRSLLWLAGAGLCVVAQATELSADERLEAVRQELLRATLQGATQVRSTAWIDGSGALREASSFRHGLQVRGVRVLGYQRDDAGQPRAQVQWQGREDLFKPTVPAKDLPAAPAMGTRAKATSSSAPTGSAGAASPVPTANASATVCARDPRLKHVLGWTVAPHGRWSVDAVHLVNQAGELLTQEWLQAAASAQAWRTLQVPSAPVAAAGSAASYERLLTAAPAGALPSWTARVQLEPAQAPDTADVPSGTPWLRASLVLTDSQGGDPVFQASAVLPLHMQWRAWAPPQLAPASAERLHQLLTQWSQAVDQRLACQPVPVQVLSAQADRVQVDQGALAGMRAGEEWLISDRQRVPQRLLEPGASSAMVLARVERVDAHRAELRVLAGPREQVQARWQAWPMPGP